MHGNARGSFRNVNMRGVQWLLLSYIRTDSNDFSFFFFPFLALRDDVLFHSGCVTSAMGLGWCGAAS